MRDFEVKLEIVRAVPDRYLAEPMRRFHRRLIQAGATAAAVMAPVGTGHLRRSTQVQNARVDLDGATIPTWSLYGPKVLDPPYPGYLDAGEAVMGQGGRVSYHYRAGPHKGKETGGWFSEEALRLLETGRDVPTATRLLAREVQEAWDAAR